MLVIVRLVRHYFVIDIHCKYPMYILKHAMNYNVMYHMYMHVHALRN